jgi:hypothetical protein
MHKPKPKPEPAQTPFQRFADLAKRIVAVPKSAVRRQERTRTTKGKHPPIPKA